MKINRIRWRNFTSWGNAWNEMSFDTDSGLNLICGQNGAGKTSIANFIIYMLYGQLDDFTQSDIPNRVNKHFEGEIDLDCDGKHVFIHRGLSPNLFEAFVDGKELNTAGKSNVQKYLEDEVFKMQYNIFKNSIILSVNVFKSFVKLTPAEKREIIDRIFGYTVINSAASKVKEKLKEVKTAILDANTTIDGYDTSIESIKGKISKLENEQVDTSAMEAELEETNKLLVETAKSYKENSALVEQYNKEVNEYSVEYANVTSDMPALRKKIDLLKKGKCPTCGSDLTDDKHVHEMDDLEKKLNEAVKAERELSAKKDEAVKKWQDVNRTKSRQVTEITNLKVRKGSLETKINAEKNKNDEVAADMRKLISDIEEKKRPLLENLRTLGGKKQLLDIVLNIFSEKGLKQYISDIYVPYINSSIIDICEKVGINYRIVFDNTYDCTIFYLGEVVKYKCLSTGERKKIDIAVTLAFLHIIKTKISDINVLFLDEVLSGIDVASCNELLKIFNGFSKDNGINMYIVHHAVLDSSFVDKTIEIEKSNGFSHFVEI